jgi:hypothetical protein
MTQVATPDTVLGDFRGAGFGDAPYYRVERDGDTFVFGKADLRERALERHPITLVTGSHHMQIYWYETGDTRKLGQVPMVWLNADQRWVPRAAVFLEPPSPARRPDESGRWSHACISCHTTHGQPRVSDDAKFDTRVAEFGVACEACHGPGAKHVADNSSPLARYREHVQGGAPAAADIVHPKRLDHRRASQICSQCHSLWQDEGDAAARASNQHGPKYRPGMDADRDRWLVQPSQRDRDPRVAATMEHFPGYVAGQFWSDGMARVSGREYSGMIDSPCYVSGDMSCLTCHTMHEAPDDDRALSAWADDQLGRGMDTDRACTQCHESFADPQRRTAHTHHLAQSQGSHCYNCHMPNTSYGLLKAMRTHRISVPSARETLETGRPNACNLCHLDKSLGWTAEKLRERYGSAAPDMPADARELPLSLWMGLTGDAGQRALIAAALGWAPAQEASDQRDMPALLGVLMDDPYDAVRYIAGRSLRSLPGVDAASLNYDFVPRPNTRQPMAARVAALTKLSPEDQARLRQLFARLLPTRDHRAVVLLE